jgi:hypothetical protein
LIQVNVLGIGLGRSERRGQGGGSCFAELRPQRFHYLFDCAQLRDVARRAALLL